MPMEGVGPGVLRQGGNFIVKLLEGPGFQEFRKQLKPCFLNLHNFRPRATRQESKEVYLVGLGRQSLRCNLLFIYRIWAVSLHRKVKLWALA